MTFWEQFGRVGIILISGLLIFGFGYREGRMEGGKQFYAALKNCQEFTPQELEGEIQLPAGYIFTLSNGKFVHCDDVTMQRRK